MRSKLLGVLVAGAAFFAGVSVGTVHRYVRQQRPVVAEAEVPASSPTFTPLQEETFPVYPETLGLSPHDIFYFIDQHPEADLTRLWQRLKITDEGNPIMKFSFGNACGACEAFISEYNLDDDVAREVVLQIRQKFGVMNRYLIFEDSRHLNPKFLGKIDVFTKYRSSDPVVLLSNNRAWLIVQTTGGTGSGLAAYTDIVYEVSDSGVRPVASYLGEMWQAGFARFPSRTFVGRPVSCEIKNGQAILEVSYTIEYFGNGASLFTKRKTVVLGASLKDGSSFVLAGQSEISQHEFETIYNFDSMGEGDFLRYNRDELRAIAAGNDEAKKTWLKEFLEICSDSAIRDEIVDLLD